MSLEDFQQAAGLYQQYVEQIKQIDMRPKNIAFSIIPIRPSVKKRKELFKLQKKLFKGKELTQEEHCKFTVYTDELQTYARQKAALINSMEFYCNDPYHMTEAEYLRFIGPYTTDGTPKEIKRAARRLSKWYTKMNPKIMGENYTPNVRMYNNE